MALLRQQDCLRMVLQLVEAGVAIDYTGVILGFYRGYVGILLGFFYWGSIVFSIEVFVLGFYWGSSIGVLLGQH